MALCLLLLNEMAASISSTRPPEGPSVRRFEVTTVASETLISVRTIDGSPQPAPMARFAFGESTTDLLTVARRLAGLMT